MYLLILCEISLKSNIYDVRGVKVAPNTPNRDLTFGGTKPTGGYCGGKPNVPVVFVVSVNPSSSDDSVDLAVCVLVVLAKAL